MEVSFHVLLDLSRMKNLWRHKDGAVAVEFAFVALPFFLMIMGILELSLYYASAVVLEGGTTAAARLIRTGQAQQSSNPEDTFKTALCANVVAMIPCESLVYEVIHPAGNTFGAADAVQPQFDKDGNLKPQGFDAGGVSDVVIIRTTYRYHFITPFIGPLLSTASDYGVTLMSTITLRSEPYAFED